MKVQILAMVIAIVIHESGHMWASLLLRLPVKRFHLEWSFCGFGIVRERHSQRWGNAFVAAGGPIFSLVAMLICCYAGMYEGAKWNLGAAVFGGALDLWNIVRAR